MLVTKVKETAVLITVSKTWKGTLNWCRINFSSKFLSFVLKQSFTKNHEWEIVLLIT